MTISTRSQSRKLKEMHEKKVDTLGIVAVTKGSTVYRFLVNFCRHAYVLLVSVRVVVYLLPRLITIFFPPVRNHFFFFFYWIFKINKKKVTRSIKDKIRLTMKSLFVVCAIHLLLINSIIRFPLVRKLKRQFLFY